MKGFQLATLALLGAVGRDTETPSYNEGATVQLKEKYIW